MRFRFTPSVVFFLALAAGFGLYLVLGDRPSEAGMAFARSEDRDPTNAEYGVSGMWNAAIACAVLSLLMAVAGGFADRPWNPSPPAPAGPSREAWIAGGLGCLLLLLLALPRMNHSLWQDEATTVRRCIAGQYRRANDQGKFDSLGENLRYREIKWADTLWEYRTPNNHPLYSISARLLNGTDDRVENGDGKLFSEFRIRLPSLLAGLGTVLLAPFVVRRLGGGRAAVVLAPLLMALSPMVVRWSSEARGYGMSGFFAVAMLWALLRALEDPRWRWWALFGFCQFGMLYSYPNWAFTFIAVNAAAFLFIVPLKAPAEAQAGARWRLTASSVAAGMAFLFLFLPNYLNFSRRISSDGDGMGWEKAVELWSYLSTARVLSGGSEFLPGLGSIPSPLVKSACVAAAALLFLAALAGLLFLVLKAGHGRWIGIAIALTGPLAFFVSNTQGVVWFSHYLTFFTPAVVLLASLGAGWAVCRWKVLPSALAAVSVYALLQGATLLALVKHPSEKNREAAELAYGGELPDAKSAPRELHAGLQQFTRNYDPWIFRIKSLDALETVIALARERKVPLHVQFGQGPLARQFYPEVTGLIEKSGQFEKVTTLNGTNHDFERHVYRMLDDD